MEGIYPLTVILTKKEAIMRKVKLIVHETYQGNRKNEDVFAAVFLSNAAALTPNTRSCVIKDTERSWRCTVKRLPRIRDGRI